MNIPNNMDIRRKYFPPRKHINQTTSCFPNLFSCYLLNIFISSKSRVFKKSIRQNHSNKWPKKAFHTNLRLPWQIVLNNIRPNFSAPFAYFKLHWAIMDNTIVKIWCRDTFAQLLALFWAQSADKWWLAAFVSSGGGTWRGRETPLALSIYLS